MLSVLIADDEWIEREGISLLLERSPYEFQVYMAENGEEAMKCLEKNTVDILFTDIKMPFMDGLELLVQANQTYKGLKIVIFSAFADFDYAKTALENRVLHYFLKPIDPDEFQTVLAQVVEAVTREQEESRRLQRPGTGAEDVMAAFLHKEGPAPEWLAKLLEGSETFRLQLYDIQDENETAIAAFYERVKDNFVLLRSIITVSEGIILLLLDEGEEGIRQLWSSWKAAISGRPVSYWEKKRAAAGNSRTASCGWKRCCVSTSSWMGTSCSMGMKATRHQGIQNRS